jgi:hypothetical protein
MRSLRDFADHLHWVVEDEDLPDTNELIDEVINMMSCFEPMGLLPAEFKSEDTRELSDQSRMFREIRTIIIEHALQYPAFFIQLQEKCSPEFQVKVFFEKINKRIDGAFNAFDEYIEHGPTNQRWESLDVGSCAARIKGLVGKIEEYRDDSLMSEAGERREDTEIERLAAVAYVRILEEVTGRNYDVCLLDRPCERGARVLCGGPSQRHGAPDHSSSWCGPRGYRESAAKHTADTTGVSGRFPYAHSGQQEEGGISEWWRQCKENDAVSPSAKSPAGTFERSFQHLSIFSTYVLVWI